MKAKNMLLLLFIMMVLTGCSSKESVNTGQQLDYDQTKKMVVDILKTDEGKKAIQDVMADEKTKQKLVMDQQVVASTIQQTLTSDKATEFWKKTFSDPKFTQSVAQNMKSQNQQLLKELMNDPEYRAMMIEVFKEPAIQKEMTDALKSKDYRSHLQQVITETMNSPLYKARIQDILMKAAEEMKAKGTTAQSGQTQSGQK